MLSIYETLVDLATKHVKFNEGGYCDLLTIDLKNKNIVNGKTTIFKDGKLVSDYIILQDGCWYRLKDLPLLTEEEMGEQFYEQLELLFNEYYLSVPDKHTNYGSTHFIAKHIDDMTVEEMTNGTNRSVARYKLELYVLFMSLLNKVEWFDDTKFFYQSDTNSNLVIYKEWFKNEETNKYKLKF